MLKLALPRAVSSAPVTDPARGDIELQVLNGPGEHNRDDGNSASVVDGDVVDELDAEGVPGATADGLHGPVEVIVHVNEIDDANERVASWPAPTSRQGLFLRSRRQPIRSLPPGAAPSDGTANSDDDGAADARSELTVAFGAAGDVSGRSDVGNNPLKIVGWVLARFCELIGIPPSISSIFFMTVTIVSVAGAFYFAFRFHSPMGIPPPEAFLIAILGSICGNAAWFADHSVR
ncbi:hypothetical protein AURDEDRAFT_164458 [Auricularia subglabra TFB-10046 SS5]|nr:hypothetical protein AURDEDRAFT_164458 [Auricularia subglabra TFB-10046 SS5]